MNNNNKIIKPEEIEVIPQIDGTCWFNAILMALLYSQGIRKVIYKETLNWTKEEIRNDKFKGFVVYVLKYNYKDPDKIRELFKRRFKTSSLLLSLLKNTPSLVKLKEILEEKIGQNIDNMSYSSVRLLSSIFLNIFFKNRNDYLSIYYNSNYMLNYINNDDLNIKPKIVFLYHYKHINKYINNFIKQKKLINIYGKIPYMIYFYERFIILNGIKYKLDACINNNYNQTKKTLGHTITGITYNNNSYIYNGWTIPKKPNTKIRAYRKEPKYACPLFAYDWKTSLIKRNSGFRISQKKCNLINETRNKNKISFNFNKKAQAILVYVREDEEETSLTSLQSNIKPEDLQFSSKSLLSIEKKIYKIDERTLDDLREQLIKIEYITRKYLKYFEDDVKANKYNIFYFMLFHKRLKDEIKQGITKEEILTEIYRELLKIYIKTNSKIYKLLLLTDDLIFNYLSIKQITKMLETIGYKKNQITNKRQLFLLIKLYVLYNKKLINRYG